MRHFSTEAEHKFWWRIRDRQLAGYKFKRQYLIGDYIVDFVCLERRLIVELDGSQHLEQEDYDIARTAFLASRGFVVLRFWNYDVLSATDGVLEEVLRALQREVVPSPATPSP